jgi:hypothetical protein
MPVYECARCNNLTYSASRFASIECDVCGGSRHRGLEHAFSFEEARDEPRVLAAGDHCCAAFDDPADVAPLCAHVIRAGVEAGARVMTWPQADLRGLIVAALEPHEAGAVEWMDAAEVLGDPFDPDALVARFRRLADDEPRPVYVIGGFDRALEERTTVEEYRRYEHLSTDAAVDTGMRIICLFDRRLHGEEFLRVGDETHPLASEGGAVKRNERFVFAA